MSIWDFLASHADILLACLATSSSQTLLWEGTYDKGLGMSAWEAQTVK